MSTLTGLVDVTTYTTWCQTGSACARPVLARSSPGTVINAASRIAELTHRRLFAVLFMSLLQLRCVDLRCGSSPVLRPASVRRQPTAVQRMLSLHQAKRP